VLENEPEAIVHQATALANATFSRSMDTVLAETSELRTHGAHALLAAGTGFQSLIELDLVGEVPTDDRSTPPATQRFESECEEPQVRAASMSAVTPTYGGRTRSHARERRGYSWRLPTTQTRIGTRRFRIDRPPRHVHGKEGVDGSSPSEGLKRPGNSDLALSVLRVSRSQFSAWTDPRFAEPGDRGPEMSSHGTGIDLYCLPLGAGGRAPGWQAGIAVTRHPQAHADQPRIDASASTARGSSR
jgi:hypothetical protein